MSDVKVKVLPNGPLLVEGPVTVIDRDGNAYPPRPRVSLCRCGHSQQKPFCDGSHKGAGFTHDPVAPKAPPPPAAPQA
jgi:CDGSH-type Zn-finger protein